MAQSGKNGTLQKSPTGIRGLDEITGGGLPTGRPTLVCGGPGCGKTMLAMEFLVRGITEHDEPGVCLMFEENPTELTENMRSLGFDLDKLVARRKLVLDHVVVERHEIEETGDYDLGGLFIRLGHAVDSIGAKRVVLDTLEALFSGLSNEGVLRAELRRLFRWLKDRGLTAVITGERGKESLTRYGLEEYVADCVILLDNRMRDHVYTRRLRIVKYRGTAHGSNAYPFLITAKGISVLPITSLLLDHKAGTQRMPSGVPDLDAMMGGQGYFRGSSILITGSSGTGKSSLSAAFIDAACARGERALLFAFEESPSQIIRNMASVNIRLDRWVKKGLLRIQSSRPTLAGLEQHLVAMYDAVLDWKPDVVAVDPISNLALERSDEDMKPMLMRLVDHLKVKGVTTVFTSLTGASSALLEDSEVGVSSLMDSWIMLRNLEANNERNRSLVLLKSRGMHHSNQVREFLLSSKGIAIVPIYQEGAHVLTGRTRAAAEAVTQLPPPKKRGTPATGKGRGVKSTRKRN